MLWGRWLRDYKGANGAKWRKCFRARLLEEMNTVDDIDPANDTSGISNLAVSLFHAGDRENAAAIVANLHRSAETECKRDEKRAKDAIGKADEVEEGLGETNDELKLNIGRVSTSYFCNNCRKAIHKVAELYVCEVCSNRVSWCNVCLALLQDPEGRKKMVHRNMQPTAQALPRLAGSRECGTRRGAIV